MQVMPQLMMLFAVLVPTKIWYTPNQPLEVNIRSDQAVTLVMTDFAGRLSEPNISPDFEAGATADLNKIFPALKIPGTYVLYATPKTADNSQPQLTKFLGTPLVISVKQLNRRNAPTGPMVIKVEPLRYAVMTTDKGPMTLIFYFDSAPNTVRNFLNLAQEGYYNDLGFTRIVKNFVIQGGDPKGDQTGGPGYEIDAEFNTRPHLPGVLSMARSGDPREPGMMPRNDFANSAGSQFFICLNYDNTKQLDGRYTAFGRVVSGMEAVTAISEVQVTGEKPLEVPKIKGIEIKPVTISDNPYSELLGLTIPSADAKVEQRSTLEAPPKPVTE